MEVVFRSTWLASVSNIGPWPARLQGDAWTAARPSVKIPPTPQMPESSKHLLLVEDEAPLRQAIAEQLADRGYLVEQAESGEEALARINDFAFDIIVTDLRLPAIDGSALVEAAVGRLSRHHRHRRHRLRHGEGRGGGHQAGRVGLRRQAVSDRRTAARARLGARAAPAEIGERLPARAARGPVSLRGHRRQEPRRWPSSFSCSKRSPRRAARSS